MKFVRCASLAILVIATGVCACGASDSSNATGDFCQDVIQGGTYGACWTPDASSPAPTVAACDDSMKTCTNEEVGKINAYVSCVSSEAECSEGQIGNTAVAQDCATKLEGVTSHCTLANLFPVP